MLKLKKLKEQQAKERAAQQAKEKKDADGDTEMKDAAPKKNTGVFSLKNKKTGGGRRTKKTNAAELRTQKDMTEIDEIEGCKLEFPEEGNIMSFRVHLTPQESKTFWFGATFDFDVTIPKTYPYEPPKVLCVTPVYHPNIDWEGHVCLNILREDWKPVLSINAVLYGLLMLFQQPNPDDPLNKEAAKLLVENPIEFRCVVKNTLKGQSYAGHSFPKLV